MISAMDKTSLTSKPILTALDRCDRCSARAYVRVSGLNGELFFCSHHYNDIMDNAVGYDAMMKFMISVVDERDLLSN